MEIGITKMSSKGQVVIPAELRKGIRKGDKLVIIHNKDQIIMKKAGKIEKAFENELAFAKETEKAWKRYEKGEFRSMESKEFLKKLDQW
ncbi:MAG: AbrB/MazE/SpoVT family DNA-binding domain-containing protein [Candidatus Woesearchaeota archaeon]|jgi:AbrB family looped-hinge helix DNA binding protein|nr:AbrB/MazE/SpoVT family DNA-binding domain-containing protein [Candidatus Woesearchaeota archaeon]MDP7323288.1 AbrB/MazE/SpoVT family DNA-binding domain-containing protein [Candidatus Woesearchaeota archaeon]MDP7458408.1 AbrB/MazE/SpoVT family DNA-binding domain-containing protein [Candidatus Woesearchaeota archaeon]